jgi:nickel/cobalt transporter (NiCoT) family protein
MSRKEVAMGRWSRIRSALTPAEWRRAAALAAIVLGLHVAGFGLLLAAGGVLGAGVGLTAYTLGLRHAFDADHIGAIDNTTRKLMGDGQRPLSVGFFFSLGHSTIVFALGLLVSLGVRGLTGPVAHDASTLHTVTGVIGPSVSGTFLFVIGILNLVILVNVVKAFRRAEDPDLVAGGLLTRLYARATRAVRAPWQMYPLGILFGLGFDTATEVALLFIAAGAAGAGLPFYAILCLPVLFAAGMTLLDTIDGAFMNFAYGWAFSQPVRKLYYNLTITGLSVAVALLVGAAELLSVVADVQVNLDAIGYVIAGLFVVTWVVALAVWRYGRIEERFSTAGGPA